jgi:SAM-dependent methyltransferase
MPRPAAPTFADACERLLRSPEGEHSLYTTLAPLFDRLTSEERVAGEFEAVEAFAADSGRALELGCSVGAMLSHLTERYHRVLGVSQYPALLRFTTHRAPEAGVAVAAPTCPPTAKSFDTVVAMGAPAAQPAEDAQALLDAAVPRLAPGGTLLLRVVTDESAVRGRTESVGVFRGSGYRLERSVTDRPGTGHEGIDLRMGYRVTDEASGESATTSETVPVRFHDAEALRTAAANAGLGDVRLITGEGTTLLVGHAEAGDPC